MPEMSINLLKDKIIKTDTVICLLVDKNEKIRQLREKLKMLYHKYVNKVKQCEALELKIDMCKVEHNPLIMNIKDLSNKYEALEKEHKLLTNTLEIKYQTKCLELETHTKKYNDLVNQKDCDKINEDVINLKCANCKKNCKVSKQFEDKNNEYENNEDKIKELQKSIYDAESNYQTQLKVLKEKHSDEVMKLENIIATSKYSESKLKEVIFDLNNKLSLIHKNVYPCNVINTNLHHENIADAINIEDVRLENSNDEEFDYILDSFYQEIPLLLSPLPNCVNEENGYEAITKSDLDTNIKIKSKNGSIFDPNNDNIENCVCTVETSLDGSSFQHRSNSITEVSYKVKDLVEENVHKTSECLEQNITENTTEGKDNCRQNNFRFDIPEDAVPNIFFETFNLEATYFGSLTTSNLPAEDILDVNIQNHNDIEDNLITHCFDDNSTYVEDYYQQNNGYTLANTSYDANNSLAGYTQNLHEIINNETSEIEHYIPKCTLANELIGFFKECEIIDKISNRTVKSYSKRTVHSLIHSSELKSFTSSNMIHISNDNNIQCNLNALNGVNEIVNVSNKKVTDVTVQDYQPKRAISVAIIQDCSLIDTSTKVPTTEECIVTSLKNISANNTEDSVNLDVNVIDSINSKDVNDVYQNNLPAHSNRNNVNNDINDNICNNLIIVQENHDKLTEVLNGENQTSPLSTPSQLDNVKKSIIKSRKQCVKKISIRTKQTKYNKMRAELFYALVEYFSRRNLNKRIIAFRKKKNGSPNFKRHRRLQMLRWKQLREIHLSNTDTDSDHSRKNRYIKRKNRRRSHSEREDLEKQTEMTSTTKEEQLSELSEDELTLREIIKEEMECQKLLSSHKELEEFYYTCNDSGNANKLPLHNDKSNSKTTFMQESRLQSVIDTIESCSADSGYVKSDSDEVNTVDTCKRKRIHSASDIENSSAQKKFILSRYLENDICDFKQSIPENALNNNEVVDSNINSFNQTIACVASPPVIIHNQREIDSLLYNGESKDVGNPIVHNNMALSQEKNNHHENVDSSYLFGSDCESISSQDDSNRVINLQSSKTRLLVCTNKHNEIKNKRIGTNLTARKMYSKVKLQNTINRVQKKETSCNVSIINENKKYSNKNASMLESNTKQIKKRSKLRKCQSSNDSEPTLQMEINNDTVDPLHTRLWEECVSNIAQMTKKVQTVCTYKRSNSLKNRQKIQIEMIKPVDTSKTKSGEQLSSLKKDLALQEGSLPENIVVFSDKVPVINEFKSAKKISPAKVLGEEKARTLLKYILTFPDKLSTVDDVVTAFSTQSKAYIARMIILEVSCDRNKADTKYTPPAPLLTETQRILLGILVRLDRTTLPGVLDHFLLEAERYILRSNKLQCMENISRLYLAICKLQRKIHRMRRMVCDAFYFMGDLSIPFLFTVLSTWIEVIPVHTEQNDDITVKVIIEIIQQKNCSLPGYNLIPLKSLLKAYYSYNMNESCLDHIILEILDRYKKNQEKTLEYAILLLCKNLEKDCITRKIKEHFHPFLENTKDTALKAKIQRIIDRISEDHK